ncbi:MAG TPA: hypothetical protein VHS59_10330 [Bacillota bacterium]|nr:hypothetical protein [Bacillota bacterium]
MPKAAMDIGTNSTRLLIVEDVGGAIPRVLHRDIRVTRVGEGMGKSGGYISEQAIDRTVAALKDYASQLQAFQVTEAFLVATAAVREACNKEVLTERVLAETGLRVRVIPGEEEARLSYLGVVRGLGGGSCQGHGY